MLYTLSLFISSNLSNQQFQNQLRLSPLSSQVSKLSDPVFQMIDIRATLNCVFVHDMMQTFIEM